MQTINRNSGLNTILTHIVLYFQKRPLKISKGVGKVKFYFRYSGKVDK